MCKNNPFTCKKAYISTPFLYNFLTSYSPQIAMFKKEQNRHGIHVHTCEKSLRSHNMST